MDKFDRIYALHSVLSNARIPVAKTVLEERLECSRATVERIIQDMRLYLDAPIEYNRNANGYYFNKHSSQYYELPGLWFNASELHALLTAYHLLSHAEPGLLESHIAPLKEKINKLLRDENAGDKQIGKRVRLLKMAARRNNPQHFLIATIAHHLGVVDKVVLQQISFFTYGLEKNPNFLTLCYFEGEKTYLSE